MIGNSVSWESLLKLRIVHEFQMLSGVNLEFHILGQVTLQMKMPVESFLLVMKDMSFTRIKREHLLKEMFFLMVVVR